MRVKTDIKRRAILKASWNIFRKQGYERTSMTMIAAKVGGSKTTLYSYFTSKEKLFAAVMLEFLDVQTDKMYEVIDKKCVDVRKVLTEFCGNYLEFILTPNMIAYMRMGITEGGTSKLGAQLFDRGPREGYRRVSKFISEAMEEKQLRKADPLVAAVQLRGLIDSSLLEPLLFGAKALFDKEAVIKAAVDAFMRIYGVD